MDGKILTAIPTAEEIAHAKASGDVWALASAVEHLKLVIHHQQQFGCQFAEPGDLSARCAVENPCRFCKARRALWVDGYLGPTNI